MWIVDSLQPCVQFLLLLLLLFSFLFVSRWCCCCCLHFIHIIFSERIYFFGNLNKRLAEEMKEAEEEKKQRTDSTEKNLVRNLLPFRWESQPCIRSHWWYCTRMCVEHKKKIWQQNKNYGRWISIERSTQDTTSVLLFFLSNTNIQRNGFIYWSNHRKFSLVCHTSYTHTMEMNNIRKHIYRKWWHCTQRQLVKECAHKQKPQQRQQTQKDGPERILDSSRCDEVAHSTH